MRFFNSWKKLIFPFVVRPFVRKIVERIPLQEIDSSGYIYINKNDVAIEISYYSDYSLDHLKVNENKFDLTFVEKLYLRKKISALCEEREAILESKRVLKKAQLLQEIEKW